MSYTTFDNNSSYLLQYCDPARDSQLFLTSNYEKAHRHSLSTPAAGHDQCTPGLLSRIHQSECQLLLKLQDED